MLLGIKRVPVRLAVLAQERLTMNAKTFAHHIQSCLEKATGLDFKRSHVYELVASALGAGSYAALMSQGLLCPLPSAPLIRRYAQIDLRGTVSRAVDLGYPNAHAVSIATQMCTVLHEQHFGLVPMEDLLTALLRGCDELYEEDDRDDDALDDLDDAAWEERLNRPDPTPLRLNNPWVKDGLRAAAARGDGRAHLAMALLNDLALQEEDDDDESQESQGLEDGRYWYERRKNGHALIGVEEEWADAYESRSWRNMSVRQHLEKAAKLGQHDALLLMAQKYGDDRFFDLINPNVRADPFWIADLADSVGRYEWTPVWVNLAAEQGNIIAMRNLIEQHDHADPLKCWTWFYLAQLHGTDLTRDNYRAIHDNGDEYDDDVGGNMFVDGQSGVILPVTNEAVRIQAQTIAQELFKRRARAIDGVGPHK